MSENELNIKAETEDGKSADVHIGLETGSSSVRVGAFVEGTVGEGKPKNLRAGVEARVKLGRKR